MNVNFQIMKRILCCLLAVLVLFCAFARPIEVSAVAAAAGALVCAITPEIAVSAAITALGITYLVQTDYEELVAAISATVPGKYLIDTLADGKQVRGVVYDHKCYLSKDFVSWVSDKLWTGTSATTTPAVSHTYGFTGIVDGVYKNCVSWLNSAYPGELNKCEAYSNCYVTRVLDDDRNRYDVCAFSNGAVEFKIDSNGYFCWGTTTDAKLIYTSGVKSNYHTAWRNGLVGDMTFSKVFPCASSFGTIKQGTGSLVFGEGLRSNGSIASSLDDEIYAGWTGKAISVSDSQTIYLPISVSDTIAGTGSLTQDVAQAGTTYYPGAVEETDEELPIVDVPVVGADLLGIITLLKSILQVLINIYRVVSSNISSWWDNATTTIALNIASLGSSIETWWTAATETIMGGITNAVTSITEAISTAIADVVTWLKSVAATLSDILEWAKGLPAAISQAISTAIADVIEWLKSLGAALADILNAVVDNSEVVCSTASIDEAYDTQLKAYTNMLSSYGVDLATYAGMIGSDEDSFKQKIREEAKEMAKQSLVLNEIAKQENITIDDSDKEALAKRYGYENLETMLQNDNIDQKMVDDTALMQKTLDFLVENAKITVSTEENNAALNTEAAEDEAK